jgi:flagellum-specific peptidoglycan hydrolase FlgJ
MGKKSASPKALKSVVIAAVGFERSHGYPAEMTVAQFGLEGAWGGAPTGDHNYFGMKARPRHTVSKMCATHEVLTERGIAALPAEERVTIRSKVPTGKTTKSGEPFYDVALDCRFASYANLREANMDKVNLIMTAPRYAAAWEAYKRDMHYETLMRGVEAAGYATGRAYARALLAIVETNTYGVLDLIEAARAGKLNGAAA